jgi:hypothetical protein
VTDYDGNGLVHGSHRLTLPMRYGRYDKVNVNVHSVLEQLRSSEPLAPT